MLFYGNKFFGSAIQIFILDRGSWIADPNLLDRGSWIGDPKNLDRPISDQKLQSFLLEILKPESFKVSY